MNDKKTNHAVSHQKERYDVLSENALNLKNSTDEIDLIDLFLVIFKNKTKVFFITVFFIIVAGLISYQLPQKWTSTATVTYMNEQQIQSLELLSAQLKLFDIHLETSKNYLLSLFIQLFDSNDLKEKYIVNTDYFKNVIKDNIKDKNKLILDIIEKDIRSEHSKNKKDHFKNYEFYTLFYTANTNKEAKDLLKGYINYINVILNEKLNTFIKDKINIKKEEFSNQHHWDVAKAKSEMSVILKRLKIASEIANAAGVKKPVYTNVYNKGISISDDTDFPIIMGTDAIDKKIDLLKSIPDIKKINLHLTESQLYLGKLRSIKFSDIKITPFEYMQTPIEPAKKDSPKSALIILLSGIMGLMLSVFYVLTQHFLSQRKNPKVYSEAQIPHQSGQ